MRINKRIKTDQGTYILDAEFTEDEMDFIVEVGLNHMLKIGSIPFIATDEADVYKVIPPSGVQN